MIPYAELCEALARWRTRQGLANGPSARPSMSMAAVAAAAPPVPEDTSTSVHVAPAATVDHTHTNTDAVAALDDDPAAGDDPATSEHVAAPPARVRSSRMGDESTGELDIDSVDLIDEE
jgi:hypothetical protein